MGLYNAMTTAISGLNAQSSKIGHISDNIANVNTTAYKKVGTTFSSLVTVSTKTVHEPSGVLAAPQYNVSLAGPTVASAINTNLAINGGGFFKVKNVPNTTDTSGQDKIVYYTRKGDFDLDADGNLVNSSGYYLTGRAYDLDSGLLDPTSTGNDPINVGNITGVSRASSSLTIGANLPAAEADVVYDNAVPANAIPLPGSANYNTFIGTSQSVADQLLFDGQGIPHSMRIVFVPVAAGAAAGAPASSPDSWTMIVTELNASIVPNEYVEHYRLNGITFSPNGSLAAAPLPTAVLGVAVDATPSTVNGRLVVSFEPPPGRDNDWLCW